MTDDFCADFLGAFAVVTRADRFLMVGNDREIGARTVRTWDLPGGRVEATELLRETLTRELLEETSLSLRGERDTVRHGFPLAVVRPGGAGTAHPGPADRLSRWTPRAVRCALAGTGIG